MKLKLWVLVAFISLLSWNESWAGMHMTELMKSGDYQKHKKQATIISQYFSAVNFSVNAENITKNKKPYLQKDTIKAVKLWQSEILAFCSGPVSRYFNAQRAVDADNSDELAAMNDFENDFKLSVIKNTCDEKAGQLNNLLSHEAQIQKEVPRLLNSYQDTLDRAEQSEVYLKKALAHATSASFKTRLSVQRQLETLISIHEIMISDRQTVSWQNEYSRLNEAYENLYQKQQALIASEFVLPNSLYKKEDESVLLNRVTDLLNRPYLIEVYFNDDSLNSQKRLNGLTRGMEYEAISFFVVSHNKGKTMLEYGWYEKNTANNNDQVEVQPVFKINSKVIEPNESRNNQSTLTEEAPSSVLKTGRQTPHESTATVATSDESIKVVGANWFVLLIGLSQNLLMVFFGLILSEKAWAGLLPPKVKKIIYNNLKSDALRRDKLALVLGALSLIAWAVAVVNFQVLAIIINSLALVVALVNQETLMSKKIQQLKQKVGHQLWLVGLVSALFGLLGLFNLIFYKR